MIKDLAISEYPIPGFLVRQRWRLASWPGAIATFWLREPVEVSVSDGLVATRVRFPKRALSSSFLAHALVAVLFVRLPFLLSPNGQRSPQDTEASLIHYDLRLVRFLKTPPTEVKSPEPEGRSRVSYVPSHPTTLGDTAASHPKFTVVLSRPRLDNRRQTIIQFSSPPDLRMTQDYPDLASVLVGNPVAIPKPKMDFHFWAPRTAPLNQEAKAQRLAAEASLAVPHDFPVALPPATDAAVHTRVPVPSAFFADAQATPFANQASRRDAGQSGDPAAAGGLLTGGVKPAAVADLLALPPGNSYGAFATSPAKPGSPNGVPRSRPEGGIGGGEGSSGEGSAGVGPAKSGSDSAGSGAAGAWSLSGRKGAEVGLAGSANTPADLTPNAGIIPVITSPPMRKDALVVFTGPVGGGGLGVYSALRGGIIYSMFLSMPGKSWVLQYCLAEELPARPAGGAQALTVQLGQGLVPPEPVKRFDFQRVPVPEEKADKLIVLQGVIRADGTVTDLKLYRGVEPEMDRAALAAFRRWTFEPALQADQPVAVEILVGIPARLPKS